MELVSSYNSSSRYQLVSVRPSAWPSTQCLRSSASRGNFILVGFLYLSQHLLFACFPTLGKILALRWIISNPFHIRSRLFLQFQYLESAFYFIPLLQLLWMLLIPDHWIEFPNIFLAMSYSLAMFYSLSGALHCTKVFICVCFKSCVISNFLRIFKVCSQSGWSKFPWHLSPISVL